MKEVAISTDQKPIPETYDINTEIPSDKVIEEYSSLIDTCLKRLMTLYLSQLAINSALGAVLDNAKAVVPGGVTIDQKAQDELTKTLDVTSHMTLIELALVMNGYTEADARMFAQSYTLKGREAVTQVAQRSVILPSRKLPGEVEDVLEKFSTFLKREEEGDKTRRTQLNPRKQNK